MSMNRKFVTLEETVVLVDLPSDVVVKGGDEMETKLMTVSSIKTWCVDWVGKPISHLLFYLVKEGQEVNIELDNKDDFTVDDLKITCNDYIQIIFLCNTLEPSSEWEGWRCGALQCRTLLEGWEDYC